MILRRYVVGVLLATVLSGAGQDPIPGPTGVISVKGKAPIASSGGHSPEISLSSCPTGQILRAIADGGWVCGASVVTEVDPTVNALGKANLTCSMNFVPVWDGSAWGCAAVPEVDPTVNALGKASLAGCTVGESVKLAGGGWGCYDPTVNTLATSLGLNACTQGQVPVRVDGGWLCGTKLDTEVDPTVNALGKATLPCIAGQQLAVNDAGVWTCVAGSAASQWTNGNDGGITYYGSLTVRNIVGYDWTTTSTIATGASPSGMVYDGTNVWVANNSGNSVTKILASTGAILGTYTVGTAPVELAVNGSYVWVTNSGDNTLSRVNISDGTVTPYNAGGDSQPFGIATNPSFMNWLFYGKINRIVAQDPNDGSDAVFESATFYGVTYGGGFIWAADHLHSNLLKYSGESKVGTIATGTNPYGVAYDGTNVWTANFTGGNVTKIPVATSIPVNYPMSMGGATPNHIAVDSYNYIWVSDYTNGVVVRMASNGTIAGTYPVGNNPTGILAVGSTIWVANAADNNVRILSVAPVIAPVLTVDDNGTVHTPRVCYGYGDDAGCMSGPAGGGASIPTCPTGQFVTTVDGGQPGCATPAGGGWITAMDLDFTTEASQSLATDGTYTIGGKTWTKINSSGDRVAMALTNGVGLVIQPTQSPDYWQSTRTIPAITLPLTSAIAGVGPDTPVRVWLYASANNWAANYDGPVLSLEYPASSTNFVSKQIYFSGSPGGYCTANANGVNQNAINLPAYAADNVLFLEVPNGPTMLHSFMASGTYSAGWPTPANLHICGAWFPSGNVTNLSGIPSTSGWDFLLGAERSGSATNNLSVTLARFRVDYKP